MSSGGAGGLRGGSSPRGRGTPRTGHRPACARRFIPAWAGNTSAAATAARAAPVHPRVGGEHLYASTTDDAPDGSSPRGRGTLMVVAMLNGVLPVHPRVGGEHATEPSARQTDDGSSPRGRGTQHHPDRKDSERRFIPAWAGNTTGASSPRPIWPVHPRVGGEHVLRVEPDVPLDGSSPRGRGTRDLCSRLGSPRRFIPAWAGNTTLQYSGGSASPVHPRVGGEHALPGCCDDDVCGSSPRGRGTHPEPVTVASPIRFIPAWAGNTMPALRHARQWSVHPRVGGEHVSNAGTGVPDGGSSPRGRGTRAT